MSRDDKIRVANWLRYQIDRLKRSENYPSISDRVNRLEDVVRDLEEEIYE